MGKEKINMNVANNGSLLGTRIRLERERKGLTQAGLGAELGCEGGAVGKWERGETKPDYAQLPALMEFLKVDAGEMLWLILDSHVPEPDSYEEISRQLRHPADPDLTWARDLAKRIMSRAEKEGAPHCHWAETLLAAVLMYMAAEIPEKKWSATTLLQLLQETIPDERYEEILPIATRFKKLEEKDRHHPAVVAYHGWERLPKEELRLSAVCAMDAVVPVVEWEEGNCEEVIRMLEAEKEENRKMQEEAQHKKEEKERLHRMRETLGVLRQCSACGKEIEPVRKPDGEWVKDERFYCPHCGLITDPAERGRAAKEVMEKTGEYLPGLEPL